jgi:hypothetical protein
MNAAVSKGVDTNFWKDLYQVALLESDLQKLPERITAAEAAVSRCVQELLFSGDDAAERESLDDALYILHALRSSLRRPPSAVIEQTKSDRDYQQMA